MKYAWIHAQRDTYPVDVMCEVLDVSRSGFYASIDREPSTQAQRREKIRQAAVESHRDSHGTYGHRRVHQDLVEDLHIECCRETVRKAMAELDLSGRQKRRFVKTTDSNHNEPIAPNCLQRDFTATRPNEKWLADITYIPLVEGWLYLAVILDCFSRRVVGWAMSLHIDADLVCQALQMAISHRCPNGPLVHHSDRGVQYASHAMRDLLKMHGLTMSMSRKGDPWDNAMTESFYGTLKRECATEPYATDDSARLSLFKYIELFYNRKRRHSSVGYVSPAEYERRYHAGELKTKEEAA